MSRKLSSYELLIVSKYFESFEDFINISCVNKKLTKYQLHQTFHFNPIPLTKQTRKYFTQLETLHLYSKEDETFPDDVQIKKKIYWYEVNYDEYINEMNCHKEFKNVVFSGSDTLKYFNKPPVTYDDRDAYFKDEQLEDIED